MARNVIQSHTCTTLAFARLTGTVAAGYFVQESTPQPSGSLRGCGLTLGVEDGQLLLQQSAGVLVHGLADGGAVGLRCAL